MIYLLANNCLCSFITLWVEPDEYQCDFYSWNFDIGLSHWTKHNNEWLHYVIVLQVGDEDCLIIFGLSPSYGYGVELSDHNCEIDLIFS